MDYRFRDFKDLAKGAGFDYPVDVYLNTVYLGTLIAKAEGYVIRIVDSPNKKEFIKETPNNLFKSKQHAANALHRVWTSYRQGDGEEFPEY